MEGIYSTSIFVSQIMIYGNSNKNNIIAIVVPNKKKCAEKIGINENEIENENNKEKLNCLIVNDFEKLAKNANFNGLEKLKFIIIDFEGFSVENKCLTPTMKIIRKNVENKFKKRIEELYEFIEKNNNKKS